MTSLRLRLCVLVLLVAVPAHARRAPNVDGRLVLDGSGSAAGAARLSSAPASAVQFVNVPLTPGAIQLDSTYYDLQDMGSLGTHLIVGPDGRVHATWQDDFCELDPAGCPPNLNAPQPHPQRGMGYAVRSGSTWSHLGKVVDPDIRNCCVTELFGGFGALAVTPTGRAAVAQHLNEEGCDLRGNFYLEDAPGGSTWTAYLTPIQSPSYLFPQVVATPGGSFVVLAEVPRGGEYDETNEFRISRVASAGTLFTCPVGWQGGPWTAVGSAANYRDGRAAFPHIAAANDGRVGIAVSDFGGNVFLYESSNGTFNAGTVTTRVLTNNVDATVTATDSTSTEYRPYLHCHLAYNDTTPNVVWSELQARRSGSDVVYADHRSRIRHWSSTRGLSVVLQVQAGEADSYDNLDIGLTGPIAGFNTLSIDWPQVGFSDDGSETYVAFLRFRDNEIDPTADAGFPGLITGVGFGDIAGSLARGLDPWSAAQNLTQTPNTDERFFSLAARNPNGDAHVLFQSSATDQAGVALIGDRGPTPGNVLKRIAYLERPLSATLVAVLDPSATVRAPALRPFPNPARGQVRLALEAGARAESGAHVEVLSPSGRRITRLALHGTAVTWDGRDQAGRVVPTGLYFARVEGADAALTTKFLFMH